MLFINIYGGSTSFNGSDDSDTQGGHGTSINIKIFTCFFI